MTEIPLDRGDRSPLSSLILMISEDPHLIEKMKAVWIDSPLEAAIAPRTYITQIASHPAELTLQLPDLIIIDLHPENLTALTDAITYRSHWYPRRPPILAISDCPDPAFIDQVLDKGADDYLLKPTHQHLLNKRIFTLLCCAHANEGCLIDPYLNQTLHHLQTLNDLKSRIITTISHEYRTPLTTISLSVGMLERYRDRWDKHKQDKHFERIHKAIEHMTGLLEDIVFVKDADFGLVEFNPTMVDVVSLCQQVIGKMQAIASSQHTLELIPQESFISWFLDGNLVAQMLTHLLSNAIKYSPQGGMIRIHLNSRNHWIEFHIQDQGIGIPKADQAQIFELFHRGSNIGHIGGTGLGLAIVKKCVDLHQGHIRVNSEIGEGTTISITLPAKTSPALL